MTPLVAVRSFCLATTILQSQSALMASLKRNMTMIRLEDKPLHYPASLPALCIKRHAQNVSFFTSPMASQNHLSRESWDEVAAIVFKMASKLTTVKVRRCSRPNTTTSRVNFRAASRLELSGPSLRTLHHPSISHLPSAKCHVEAAWAPSQWGNPAHR